MVTYVTLYTNIINEYLAIPSGRRRVGKANISRTKYVLQGPHSNNKIFKDCLIEFIFTSHFNKNNHKKQKKKR